MVYRTFVSYYSVASSNFRYKCFQCIIAAPIFYGVYSLGRAYYKCNPEDIVVTPEGVYRVGVDSGEGPPPTHNRVKKLREPPIFAGTNDEQLHHALLPHKLHKRKRLKMHEEFPFQSVSAVTLSSLAFVRLGKWYFAPEECDIVRNNSGSEYRVGIDSAEGPPPTHNRKKQLPPDPHYVLRLPDRV